MITRRNGLAINTKIYTGLLNYATQMDEIKNGRQFGCTKVFVEVFLQAEFFLLLPVMH